MTHTSLSIRLPGFDPQPRDLELLEGLFQCRLLTIPQAAALYFGGSYDLAKRRLRKLHQAGVVTQRRLKTERGNGPAVYFFNKRSFDLLKSRLRLAEFTEDDWNLKLRKRAEVSERTLAHEVAVMDVKAALEPALNQTPGIQVTHFGTWPAAYAFSVRRDGRETILRPDGFLRFDERKPDGAIDGYDFFLEVDRGSESLATLSAKVEAYRAYYRSGGYRDTYGVPDAPIDLYPFRILIVALTAERRNNIAERLLALPKPVMTRAWLTTFDQAAQDPLGSIWIFPKLYHQAVLGTPFAPTLEASRRSPKTYMHRPARDAFIAQNLKPLRLLDDPSDAPGLSNQSAEVLK